MGISFLEKWLSNKTLRKNLRTHVDEEWSALAPASAPTIFINTDFNTTPTKRRRLGVHLVMLEDHNVKKERTIVAKLPFLCALMAKTMESMLDRHWRCLERQVHHTQQSMVIWRMTVAIITHPPPPLPSSLREAVSLLWPTAFDEVYITGKECMKKNVAAHEIGSFPIQMRSSWLSTKVLDSQHR